VPSLPTTPPSAQLQHTPLKSPPLEQTTALNPSSSRFTLSIPLLGRVLGKEKEKGVFLICVNAFVLSFKLVFLILSGRFGLDVRKYVDDESDVRGETMVGTNRGG